MNNSPANNSADKLISDIQNEKVKTVGSDFDRKMMQRCLELARRGLGRTSPNPMVGAVVV